MANYHASRTGRSTPFRMPGCFTAPPPPALPNRLVLGSSVNVEEPPLGLDKEWARVECAKRTAYGCGEHCQEILDGLTLYVRLVRPGEVTSALYIGATDGALGAIRKEFAGDRVYGDFYGLAVPMEGLKLQAEATIKTAEENSMVLAISFHLQDFGWLCYYIVYDAADRSLVMIPCAPEPSTRPTGGTLKPLTLPRDRSDGAGGYGLAVMSRKLVPPPPVPEEGGNYRYDDVIYVWTPSARLDRPALGNPWRLQGRTFPQQVQEPFFAELSFTFQSKSFFVDLSQGLVYCDEPSTNADGTIVHFEFIPLPAEIPSALRWECEGLEDTGTLDRKRSMRCVGGVITFVCIDSSLGLHEDVKMSVWTLDLSNKCWNKVKELRAIELWKLLSFRRKGLPETPPKCPLLMLDGTITFCLPNLRKTKLDPIEDYICNVNLQSMRVVWYARLDSCSYTAPVILPWDFFKKVIPPSNTAVKRGIFM